MLVPAARIDRDRVMYFAGRRSVEIERARGGWRWPAATGLATAVAAALAVLLAIRPDSPPPAQSAEQPAVPAVELVDHPSGHFRLRQELFSGASRTAATPAPKSTLRPRDFDAIFGDDIEL
jgi:hypothetical protein